MAGHLPDDDSMGCSVALEVIPGVTEGASQDSDQLRTQIIGVDTVAQVASADLKNSQLKGGCCANESQRLEESVLLSPGFRSAAAMAGWDAETLLMAALNPSPIDAGEKGRRRADLAHTPESPAAARKRDRRTPLSSSRRNRRGRWNGSTGSPLGRLPMMSLTHLSDNELDSGKNENRQLGPKPLMLVEVHPGSEGKENCHPRNMTSKEKFDLKGKEKQTTPVKAPCLDQLREELSCAVCLDICFEPSTISCGHSFCGTCLQFALQKCGPRCPKCRQTLRTEALRNCRINTVLWNTIQILFPKETSSKIQEQQRKRDGEAKKKASSKPENRSKTLGIRPSRLQSWGSAGVSQSLNNVNRINEIGNLRPTSFQTAAELLMVGSADNVDETTSRPQRSSSTWINREDRQRSIHMSDTATTPRSRSMSRRRNGAAQSRDDAALAARLQFEELNPNSEAQELPILEGPRERSCVRSVPVTRPMHDTVANAASNLRTVASRAVRQHRRTRS